MSMMKLHAKFEETTKFDEQDCGCIVRGDGMYVRYCTTHHSTLKAVRLDMLRRQQLEEKKETTKC